MVSVTTDADAAALRQPGVQNAVAAAALTNAGAHTLLVCPCVENYGKFGGRRVYSNVSFSIRPPLLNADLLIKNQ